MVKIKEVKPLDNFKIQINYEDGVEGIVDLSYLAGKGVFSFWNEPGNFNKVHIDKESGAVAWNKEIDICPDSLYMKLTGKKLEEILI